MTMETNKHQYKEPFKPEDTPTPPQSMHPGPPAEQDKKSPPEPPVDSSKKEKKPEPKKKLLGESEIEIDDETTI
jgi:hypothetical protein